MGDEIAIYWHVEDIKEVDNSLSHIQAQKVLLRLKNNHRH